MVVVAAAVLLVLRSSFEVMEAEAAAAAAANQHYFLQHFDGSTSMSIDDYCAAAGSHFPLCFVVLLPEVVAERAVPSSCYSFLQQQQRLG